ncbi:ubiquinone biosynthesis protein-like protein [Perkinsela sp. CCAP 1560/4]|nr:ubiquinone biosynthesis protein-like protein [Perkinsela sp. CCAP 1560/4]|eukprot:KNH04207.1 ubiquinone biosynthesis protein-like protein [Perkinsela sp. CCAP 1560/4]
MKNKGIVSLSIFQRSLLLGGSALGVLLDPTRGDLLATLTETAFPTGALRRMRQRMMQNRTGRSILESKPLVTDEMFDQWSRSPAGNNVETITGSYVQYMKSNGFLPSGRSPVRFLRRPHAESCAFKRIGGCPAISQDEFDDLVYILQRYREVHDFLHALTGLGSSEYEEGLLKYFEWTQTRLPTTMLSVVGVGIRQGVCRKIRESLRGEVTPNGASETSHGLPQPYSTESVSRQKGAFLKGFQWIHKVSADFRGGDRCAAGNLYLNRWWEKELDAGKSLRALRAECGIQHHFLSGESV